MDFFWSVSKLSDSSSQYFLRLVEFFQFAVYVDQVKEDSRTFLHAKLLAEICAVLAAPRTLLLLCHLTGWILHCRKSENVLKRLLGLVPVFLLDFHLRFHQHEDRVVPDAEILRERLFEEVVRSAHVPCIRVDHCG